jgi:hypothetical protein
VDNRRPLATRRSGSAVVPSPVNPPAPPEPPEVHVTIIPQSEPRVTTDRLRGNRNRGSQMGAGERGGGGAERPAGGDGPAE